MANLHKFWSNHKALSLFGALGTIVLVIFVVVFVATSWGKPEALTSDAGFFGASTPLASSWLRYGSQYQNSQPSAQSSLEAGSSQNADITAQSGDVGSPTTFVCPVQTVRERLTNLPYTMYQNDVFTYSINYPPAFKLESSNPSLLAVAPYGVRGLKALGSSGAVEVFGSYTAYFDPTTSVETPFGETRELKTCPLLPSTITLAPALIGPIITGLQGYFYENGKWVWDSRINPAVTKKGGYIIIYGENFDNPVIKSDNPSHNWIVEWWSPNQINVKADVQAPWGYLIQVVNANGKSSRHKSVQVNP